MSSEPVSPPFFETGPVFITPYAKVAVETAAIDLKPWIERHQRAEWPGMAPEDFVANMRAIADGSRILGRFTLSGDLKIWVITDAEDEKGVREHTTVMLPSEY